MSTGKRIYFRNLDAIRFYAALMVFIQHGFAHSFKFLPVDGTPIRRLLQMISSGGTGVSIFFVLSGFLITYLLIQEHLQNSKINIKHFYMRRFLRIWPLYFAVVIFGFILYPQFKSLMGASNLLQTNPIYYFLFLSNFDVINVQLNHFGSDAASQTITWSVAIEEQFYLFWPLIFFLKKKFWLPMISLIGLGSIAFRLYNYTEDAVLYFHTFSVIIDLCIGGIVAYLACFNQKFRNYLENTDGKFHLACFLLLFVVMYFGSSLIFGDYEVAAGRIIKTLLFGIIIGAQAFTQKDSILNLGNFNFGTNWGKYTYGIYLIHPIIITLLLAVIPYLGYERNTFIKSFLIGVVALILTLVASRLSYDYFEKPFLNLKSKFQIIKT